MKSRVENISIAVLALLLLTFHAQFVLALYCSSTSDMIASTSHVHHSEGLPPPVETDCSYENGCTGTTGCLKRTAIECLSDLDTTTVVVSGLQKWYEHSADGSVSSLKPPIGEGVSSQSVGQVSPGIPANSVYLLNVTFLC